MAATCQCMSPSSPELVSKVITLHNLREPLVLNSRMKIISFRSKDPNSRTDPGVMPTPAQAKTDGVGIVDRALQRT